MSQTTCKIPRDKVKVLLILLYKMEADYKISKLSPDCECVHNELGIKTLEEVKDFTKKLEHCWYNSDDEVELNEREVVHAAALTMLAIVKMV